MTSCETKRRTSRDEPPPFSLCAQVRDLKAEVFHLEGVVKDKEELIRYLEEEKAAEGSLKEKDLADLRLQLQANQDNMASRVTELEEELKDWQQRSVVGSWVDVVLCCGVGRDFVVWTVCRCGE